MSSSKMNTRMMVLILAAVTTSAFASDPIRPDPKLTPGATLGVAISQLVVKGYANKIKGGVRNVPESKKRAAFAEYGITNKPHVYEIDHLISLELGGSNDLKNLWPQSYLTMPWNARVKDRLEDRMAALVRSKYRSDGAQAAAALLAQFQHEIATDWIAAYLKYSGKLLTQIKKK